LTKDVAKFTQHAGDFTQQRFYFQHIFKYYVLY